MLGPKVPLETLGFTLNTFVSWSLLYEGSVPKIVCLYHASMKERESVRACICNYLIITCLCVFMYIRTLLWFCMSFIPTCVHTCIIVNNDMCICIWYTYLLQGCL